jgi:hypothetical protein
MGISCKACLFACALGLSFGPIGAKAVPVTPCTCTYNLNSPSGVLGTTQTYTMRGPGGPVTITADGFSGGFASSVNLFGKNDGGNENGLGVIDDPTGANEISGTSFIRISFPEFTVSQRGFGATGSFRMGSTTGAGDNALESWRVLASTSATTGYVPLLAGNDELEHGLPSRIGGIGSGFVFQLYPFYIFEATSGNVCSLLFRPLPVPSPVRDCRA